MTRQLHLTSTVNSPATGAPAVVGTARVGATLAGSTALVRDANGLPESYRYQWIIENEAGTTSEDIAGATSSSYVVRAGDAGNRVRVKVTFTDGDLYEETLTSAAFPMRGTIAAAPPVMGTPSDVWSATLMAEELHAGVVAASPETGSSGAPTPTCSPTTTSPLGERPTGSTISWRPAGPPSSF